MSSHDAAFPLSAVGLRLTDEVGQAVLDWVAAGDLALSAALDQHVAEVRAALAACPPDGPGSAWQAGQAAHQKALSRAARSRPTRPHHARRYRAAAQPDSVRDPAVVTPVTAEVACPDAPFADSPWHADATLPLRLLLHYACGFVEAAVRADWWPGENETATDALEFESVRLAAVCRLVRQAEAATALPPDLR
jgi:Family of unknown function (DUF6401)